MPFSDPDLIYDDMATAEEVLAGMSERRPGLVFGEGHSLTLWAEAWGVAVATAMIELRERLQEAYANGFGRNVLGLERGAPVSASTTGTWQFTNTDPVTIPGGTEVQALGPAEEAVVLVVASDTEKVAGLTSVQTTLVAIEPGTASNGAAGEGTTDFVGPPNNPVLSVDLDVPAANGQDEQSLEAWLLEVREDARRLHSVPITPEDHAAKLARVPGIERVYVRNRYDPADGSPGDEAFHATFWAVDAGGLPVDTPTKDAGLALLEGYDRPHAMTYHAEDVDELAVTIVVDVVAKAGEDQAALAQQIEDNIVAAFSRGTWDLDTTRAGMWAEVPTTVLRSYRVVAAFDDLAEIQDITSVTVNGGASVALPPPLTMPVVTPASVTVNVS